MARNRFKGSATSKSFKGIGASLQASRGELEKKTRRDVDSLKLAKLQRAELDKISIGDLTDNARSEEYMLKEKQGLEQKARQTRYEAVSKHADTDVKRLEGEALEAKKYADHWKDLAPKAAKAAGKFAKGAYVLQDTVRGIEEWKKFEVSGQLKTLTDLKADVTNRLVFDADKDRWILSNEGNADGATALGARTINLSTHYSKRRFVDWVKQNKQLLIADVKENIKAAGGEYNENSAIGFMELGGLSILEQLGVSRTSRAGRQIIDNFRAWGGLDKHAFYENRKVEETRLGIEEATTIFRSAYNDPEATQQEKSVAYNNLVLAFKNGWFKTDYGKVLDPNNGGGQYYNTADSGIAAMKHLIDTDTEGTITTDNVYEKLAGFGIPGTTYEWTTDQEVGDQAMPKETWSTKHRTRFDEEIVPYLVKAIKDRETEKKDKKEADGIVFNTTFKQKIVDARADGILDIRETVSLFKTIESADISDAQKAIAFNEINYFPTDYNKSGNLRNALSALESGDMEQALKIINASGSEGLSANDKNFLKTQVQGFQDLHEAQGMVGTDVGMAALLKEMVAEFKSEETNRNLLTGQKSLDTSGKTAAVRAQGMVLEIFLDSGSYTNAAGEIVPSTLSPKERLRKAKEVVKTLRKSALSIKPDGKGGWLNADGTEITGGLDMDNPFHYQLANAAGTAFHSTKYPLVGLDQDQLNSIQVEKIFNQEEDLETAQQDWLNKTSLIPLQTKNMGVLLENNVISLNELLKSPRVVSPDLLSIVKQGAVDLQEGRYTVIPNLPNVQYLVNSPYAVNKDDKRLSYTQTVNTLLAQSGATVMLPPDHYDQVIQQNGGTNNFNERDVAGVSIWTACQAQGCFPKSFAAEGVLQGLDKNQSFFTQFPEAETDLGAALTLGAMFKTDVDMTYLQEIGVIPEPKYWSHFWSLGLGQSTEDYNKGMDYIRLRNRSYR